MNKRHAGRTHLAVLWVLSVAAPAMELSAAEPALKTSSADIESSSLKTHTLFMGVDLFVAREKKFYRVRDVLGGSFVIDVNGRTEHVQMNSMFGGPVSLRVDRALKLSRISADLAHLTGERAYSPGSDPNKIIPQQMISTQMAVADQRIAAEVNVIRQAARSGANPMPMGIETGKPLSAVNPSAWSGNASHNPEAGTAFNSSMLNEATDRTQQNVAGIGGTDNFAKRLEEELALELFDAIEVNFDATCEQPLGNPYVVVIARFREREAKPGMVQNWIFAKALDPIGTKRQKVHILESGFPRGYTLLDYEVHLYDQGLEVASNVAPKRVALTGDEAFQYMVIDHVSSHKGATLGAIPVLATLPADYRARLQAGEYQDSIYVKVSRDGRAEEAFFDAAGSRRIEDPYLLAVLQSVRFKPALANGQPVDGVTELRLNKLTSL